MQQHFLNVPCVNLPKKYKSYDFPIVKKGIKNQAWDIPYLINWSNLYSNETGDSCYMFATDDITLKT